MTQDATVIRIIDRNTAEVEVKRATACAGDCDKCAAHHGCSEMAVYDKNIRVVVRNPVYAKVGDLVEISTETKGLLGFMMLLYMLPLAAFLAGYIVTAMMGMPENVSILTSSALFLLSGGIVILNTRRKKSSIDFEITSIKG